MAAPFVVSLLGAESTGKSVLALQLAAQLSRRTALRVVAVPEALRTWCEQHGRTPRREEQTGIAQQQTADIDAARACVTAPADPAYCLTPSSSMLLPSDGPKSPRGVVIADTTALMTAVYSDVVFGDASLYPYALRIQKQYDLCLLMGLDLPWVRDGFQRDGPHMRDTADAKLRAALQQNDVAFTTVYGHGDTRWQAAQQVIEQALTEYKPVTASHDWQRWCDCCGDGECERRLFKGLGVTPD